MFASPPTSYTPPKIVSRAPNVVEPAGAGHVLVQVQVNADGSFKVLRIMQSTNNGDNKAAMDVAAHSTYAPAMKNGKPVSSILDFEVVFGAQSVSGAAGQIDSMLHSNDFQGAKAAATSALEQDPGNHLVQAQLGVANAFLRDIPGSVSAFDQAGTIPDMYQSVAMQAYALNAVAIANTEPRTAYVQAQRAIELNGDYRAYFALGVAQQANKNYADALTTLKKAETMAQSAYPPDPESLANIEQALLTTAQSAGDKATADRVSAQLAKMDPGSSGKSAAYNLDLQATQAAQRRDYTGAISLYEKAAQAAPDWAGPPEYTKAAIILATEPLPNYQAARLEAEKAMALAPDYALAYYVEAVAMGQDALGSGNMDELQRATDSAYKASQLAEKGGDAKLAASAAYFAKNHQVDMNLQIWSTGLSINPRYYLPFPVPNS